MKRLVTAQYDSTCVSNGCEIQKGDEVWWAKLTGVWCKECPEPQSVRLDQKDQSERIRLGLEAPEFGSAPMLPDRKQ